ncbi:MAG: Rpn family recombination-promoting nuclease/putative transposase, partial [Methanomicrobiales archaeon]|nr:Rpn family recombination-promoting nuclease/putative transposase [Methanomicrobiales archaeon]
MNTPEIYHIHDNFVRQMLSRTIIYLPFVQYYIQPRLVYQLDSDNLQSAMNDVSSELLEEYRIDFVLKTTTKDNASITVYIVFEHKSEYDAGVFGQAGNYCEMLKKNFESNHPGELIDIVPVIIYHGAKKWNVLAHGSNQHIKGQHF